MDAPKRQLAAADGGRPAVQWLLRSLVASIRLEEPADFRTCRRDWLRIGRRQVDWGTEVRGHPQQLHLVPWPAAAERLHLCAVLCRRARAGKQLLPPFPAESPLPPGHGSPPSVTARPRHLPWARGRAIIGRRSTPGGGWARSKHTGLGNSELVLNFRLHFLYLELILPPGVWSVLLVPLQQLGASIHE